MIPSIMPLGESEEGAKHGNGSILGRGRHYTSI